MGDLLKFGPVSTTADPYVTGKDSVHNTGKAIVSISSEHEPQSNTYESISTKDLYPLSDDLNPVLARALLLLDEGKQYINEAINKFAEVDLLSSDDALQKFQVLLPELFCCRVLGDGFGAIVNSVYHALRNLDGVPLKPDQFQVILYIINRISTEPFIEFKEAVDEIMFLENVGLVVDPSHFKFAADMLIE